MKAKAEPGLWLDEVPVPEVGGDDVLIRVLKASICGTDVHIYNWDEWAQKTIPVPMTIGHEFVGVVESVGDHVKGFARGDLVVGEGHITCGHCRNCLAGRRHLCPNTQGVGVNRPGAWAELVAIPQDNCWHADPSIPLDVLSCFDPLGNAVHTALSFDLVGEDVLITGAGPIGCMAIPICKRAGARHVIVTDVNAYRLNLARKMGADPERPRYFPGHHASLSLHRIQGSHRADEIRKFRQSGAQLEQSLNFKTADCTNTGATGTTNP